MRAAVFLQEVQDGDGGWAKGKGEMSETWLTAWALVALEAAVAAELVAPEHRAKAEKYFAKAVSATAEVYDRPWEKKGPSKALAGALLYLKAASGGALEGTQAKCVDTLKAYRAGWDGADFSGWAVAALGARAHGGEGFDKMLEATRGVLVKNAEADGTWMTKKWGLELRPMSTALGVVALAAIEKWEAVPGLKRKE
jgi:hypothetical protein